jgi:hypothetical protein
LRSGGIPNPNGPGAASVSSNLAYLFRANRTPIEVVHDVQAGLRDPAGIDEPFEKGTGLLAVPEGQERVDAYARIARPGVSIIPRPIAAQGGRK